MTFIIMGKFKTRFKDNTFQNYKYMYNQFAREYLGNIKVCELEKNRY